MNEAIIREFETENFRVVVCAEQENDLDISWDETGETADGLDSGSLIAFCAHAYVEFKPTGARIAHDYLGNCIYKSLSEFEDHIACGQQTRELRAAGNNAIVGSYFSDMVKNVCQEARRAMQKTQAIKIRKV